MTGSIEDSWRIRIRGLDAQPHGAGVLIADELVLTCAHVVENALGIAAGDSPEGRELRVEFTSSTSNVSVLASVRSQGWVAPGDDFGGDLAVLLLGEAAPEDCVPARLHTCGPAGGRRVRTFGHAVPDAPGKWASARLLGPGGHNPEWVQLGADFPTTERVCAGYHGAGVVDPAGNVVGVVMADDPGEGQTAWMMPVEVAARLCPVPLHDVVVHTDAVPAAPPAPARGFAPYVLEPPVGFESFARLRDILEAGERADLWYPIAKRVLPEEIVALPSGPVTAGSIGPDAGALLEVLNEALPDLDQPHPLLVFAEALAVHETPTVTRLLRAWTRHAAAALGCTLAGLKAVRAAEVELSLRPLGPARLLVEITARPAAADDFHVRGWLLVPGRGNWIAVHDVRGHTRPWLKRTVADIHRSVLERLGELGSELRVEFLLPRPLLWLDVDQFPVRPFDAVARPIGAEHVVVVRSRERYDTQLWWRALRERRKRITGDAAGVLDDSSVHTVPVGTILDPRHLSDRLRHDATLVCFVLMDPPLHGDGWESDPVIALLERGIPAIVAVRDNGDHPDAAAEVSALLAGEPNALPQRVWRLRGGVGVDGRGLSALDLHRHVTLVWEDEDGLERAEATLGHPPTGGGVR